jgi:YjbE family integral membrane protein
MNEGAETNPMDFMDLQFWLLLLQIMAVNIILSGDNAVVIALACRNLPPKQQKLGIFFGAGAAVVLLILFTIFVAYLLGIPFLRIIFGALLFWIAYKLMLPQDEGDDVEAANSLMQAIRIVVIADIIMSFDNIVAVAAVAKGNFLLLTIGLAISIPMVVYGAKLLIGLLNRFPIIIPGAAALIGFVGGEIVLEDPIWKEWIAANAAWAPEIVPLLCSVAVVLVGRMVSPAEADSESVAEEAVEAAALVGVRTVGQILLARAPMIVAFIASAFGYTEGGAAEGADGGMAGSALDAVHPIFGAVIAIAIAELLAWAMRRARGQQPVSS